MGQPSTTESSWRRAPQHWCQTATDCIVSQKSNLYRARPPTFPKTPPVAKLDCYSQPLQGYCNGDEMRQYQVLAMSEFADFSGLFLDNCLWPFDTQHTPHFANHSRANQTSAQSCGNSGEDVWDQCRFPNPFTATRVIRAQRPQC